MYEFYYLVAVTIIFTVLITGMYIGLIWSKQYKTMGKWKFIWATVFTVVLWVGDLIAFISYFMNK